MERSNTTSERPKTPGFPLEAVGGAVPLGSNFYIHRRADDELAHAIDREESIILIKGARQVGKTSLLARGLHQARTSGSRIVLTDFQKVNSESLKDITVFYKTLAHALADRLDLDEWPDDIWDESLSPNVNLENYFLEHVLKRSEGRLVWAMDEVDRIFTCKYASDVFALFRAWHNERALDPHSAWSRLTIIITYATEAALFISDLNMSPFNVGTRLVLEDFTLKQVSELNVRHGSPLKSDGELRQFYQLVGGQPYLVRRSFHEMVGQRLSIAEFSTRLTGGEHVFEDHLKRIILLLTKDLRLENIVRGWLKGQTQLDQNSFKRLQQGGLLKGISQQKAEPRCGLYHDYLRQRLLT